MMTQAEAEAWLDVLPPLQRALAESLVRLIPDYRYDLTLLPPLDPPPAPGLPSAIAVVEAITAYLDARRAP